MSKYLIEGETFRIKFPDGEWWDIIPEQTQEEADFLANIIIGDRNRMNFAKLPLLVKRTVAWSFKDNNQKPLPITPENISKTKSKYRTYVFREIDRLDKEANEFSKNSLGAST